MFKAVATKIALFAFDTTTSLPKTGDAANLTAYVSKDYGGVTVLGDTSATEMDATNAKGWYLFDVTGTEATADALLFTGKSSTANISVVGQLIFTTPANFSTLSVDSNGRVDVIKVAGTTQTARDIGASVITASGTVTTVTNQLTAAQIATGVWQDATGADFTTGGSIGKSLYTSGALPGASGGLFTCGVNAATSVNITGTWTGNIVGTLSTLTTYTGNTPQTGDAFGALTGNRAEPGQGTPAANAPPLTKLDHIFKGYRNKVTQTAGVYSLFNSGGTVVDQKSTTSNDGTTYTKGELATGP